jgi:hypothetical protein
MPKLNRVLFTWVTLGALATAVSLLVYLVAQQTWRTSANDPQIQLARDAADALGAGRAVESVVPRETVDMERSLAPFLIVLDANGRVLAASGRLRGHVTGIPKGVLDYVRDRGEDRITWQPIGGVRIASVIVSYSGTGQGFVLAGRSLEETEHRVAQFGNLIAFSWAVTLVALLVVAAAGNWMLSPRSAAL